MRVPMEIAVPGGSPIKAKSLGEIRQLSIDIRLLLGWDKSLNMHEATHA